MTGNSTSRLPLIVTSVSIGLLFGTLITGGVWWMMRSEKRTAGSANATPPTTQPTSQPTAESELTILYWTCAMHPSVRAESNDEKCPICHMDLVPVYASDSTPLEESDVLSRLTVTEQGRALAKIDTAPVTFRQLEHVINATGRLTTDERRVSHVHTRVGGWVDKVFVEFTGVEIAPGDPLLSLYSEELVTGQQEYLLALENDRRLRDSSVERARQGAESLLEAARERLRRWELTEEQIDALGASGQPSEQVTLHYSPSPDTPEGGVVTERLVKEGTRVMAGDQLLTVADLTHLWMMADVYESEIAWVERGQSVEIQTSVHPGRMFEGEIAFIEPSVNPQSRTIQVRVDVQNPDMVLRPEMWVDARVLVPLAHTGSVISRMREDATGQMGSRLERSESHVTALTPDSAYLCPMLCEGGESNEPDQHCPVCGVLLLRREDVLGTAATASVTDSRLAPEGAPEGSVLAIPDLAVLRTGEREIVYVQEEPGVYARREIITGPAGIAVIDGERSRYVPVLAGLEPGMRVVTRGNFLLDSQSALTGAASAAYGSALDTEDAAPMPSGHQH